MMHEPEIEQMLEDLPSRGLPPGAHERIEKAIAAAARATNRGTARAWWACGVPLWLAAAACVTMCVGTALLVRGVSGADLSPLVAQQRVETPEQFPDGAGPVTAAGGSRTDISRWEVIEVLTDESS